MAKVDVLKVATPPERVPVPRVAVPSLNVAVPVGVPEVVAFTVAVNFTVCPKVDGFGADVSAVLVEALFTV